AVAERRQDVERGGTLDLGNPGVRIRYLDVQCLRMGDEPGEHRAVGLAVPERVGFQSNQDTVAENIPIRIAQQSVTGAPGLDLGAVARKYPVAKFDGIGTLDLDGPLAGIEQAGLRNEGSIAGHARYLLRYGHEAVVIDTELGAVGRVKLEIRSTDGPVVPTRLFIGRHHDANQVAAHRRFLP